MRYKLKKFDVDAEQFDPQPGKKLPEGVHCPFDDETWSLRPARDWLCLSNVYEPSNLNHYIAPGDWIVRTNRGEVYRMSDYDFQRTYTAHDFPRLRG